MTRARVIGMIASAAALLLVAQTVRLAAIVPTAATVLFAVSSLLLAAAPVLLGWLVLRQSADNVVGGLLCLLGVTPPLLFVSLTEEAVRTARPGEVSTSDVVVTLSVGSWMLLYVAPVLLMLFFPTGRLLGRRWRPVTAAVLLIPLLFMVVAGMDPTPFPEPYTQRRHVLGTPTGLAADLVGAVGVLLLFAFLATLVASATSLVVRYRRSHDEVERDQLRWLALAALTIPGTLLLCWFSYLTLGTSDLVVLGFLATWIAIPTATAIALLKHHLYDVQRLSSAALTFGTLTALLLFVYTVVVTGVGALVGGSSPLLAAAAAAVAAVTLAPVRRRAQRLSDRIAYPRRRRVLEAVDQLARTTDAGVADPEDLQDVLRRELDEPDLVIGLRIPGQLTEIDTSGRLAVVPAVASPDGVIPIRLRGLSIGSIQGTTRTRPALLREVADASALLVEVTRLRVEVRMALAETEASRRRLQEAGYGERRRLERDLHDGAQQRLVSLGMALRVAQGRFGDRPGDAAVNGLLDEAVAELATAVAELRQLAHGLRPSCLDDGLGPALASLTQASPIPVTIDVAVGVLPDEVATTAYFVIAEAVANSVKHAHPGRIGIEVRRGATGQVILRVRDDGRGGVVVRGAGLAGMADRVAAIGGTLRLESPPARGTLLEAVLPCAS